MSAHRVRLHEALKEKASTEDGFGRPCELHLSSSVIDVDPDAASITLVDGTKIDADIVIGADGVHSKTRRKVPGGENAKTFSSGKSGFRFMMTRESVLDDPITRSLCDKPGIFTIILGTDRRIIMYSTSGNTLLNFFCIHPEAESDAGDDWNTTTNKEALLRVFRDFAPEFQALLRKADPESLKLWRLLDMKNLPTFVNSRLALIGDAAHPFLPHQGQGGAMAMEDAVALGVVLEKGLTSDEVPERLQLYNSIRYDRACRIQENTRLTGLDVPDQNLNSKPSCHNPIDQALILIAIEHRRYNFAHDEFHHAAQKLREWKWARMGQPPLTMPLTFPPPLTSPTSSKSPSFITASIQFRTSRTLLQNFLPSGVPNFLLEAPGTVVTCSFTQTTLNGVDWLDGGCCKIFGLYVNGVSYSTSSGRKTRGTYVPILFEDQVDGVISDRENFYLPAIYSSMTVERGASNYHFNASSQGGVWMEFVLEDLQPVTSDELRTLTTSNLAGISGAEGLLTWKSSPKFNTEAQTKDTFAAENCAFWVPFEKDDGNLRVTQAWTTNKASVLFKPDQSIRPPALREIASRLSEVPVFQILSAQVAVGSGTPTYGQPQRL